MRLLLRAGLVRQARRRGVHQVPHGEAAADLGAPEPAHLSQGPSLCDDGPHGRGERKWPNGLQVKGGRSDPAKICTGPLLVVVHMVLYKASVSQLVTFLLLLRRFPQQQCSYLTY